MAVLNDRFTGFGMIKPGAKAKQFDQDSKPSSPSTVNVPEGLSHAQRMEWLDTQAKIEDRQRQIAAKRGERYLAPDNSSRTIKRD